jgi:hypothetical protein
VRLSLKQVAGDSNIMSVELAKSGLQSVRGQDRCFCSAKFGPLPVIGGCSRGVVFQQFRRKRQPRQATCSLHPVLCTCQLRGVLWCATEAVGVLTVCSCAARADELRDGQPVLAEHGQLLRYVPPQRRSVLFCIVRTELTCPAPSVGCTFLSYARVARLICTMLLQVPRGSTRACRLCRLI